MGVGGGEKAELIGASFFVAANEKSPGNEYTSAVSGAGIGEADDS